MTEPTHIAMIVKQNSTFPVHAVKARGVVKLSPLILNLGSRER